MSDSFMVAARIEMTREGFEEWLGTPVPGLDVIVNPQEMFDGWFWDGTEAGSRWENADLGITPRDFFADRVEDACEGGPISSVLSYRNGALEAYLFHAGYQESSVHTALLMLAAAGAYKTGSEPAVALFWAETGGSLGMAEWPGRLAVLSVGRDAARFIGAAELSGVIEGLLPVEERFFALVQRLGDEEEAWDWRSGEPYWTGTPRDPAFVDPAVLAASP